MKNETLHLVRQYIIDGLASGAFAGGQRLPAERKLAEKFGTSRAAVRQALMILESEKRVTRHVGRGTFLTGGETPTASREDRSDAPRPHIDASPAQFMQARQLMEPRITELVVISATERELGRIRQIVESQHALTGDEFEASDIEFHTALAMATRNELLVATALLFNGVRQDPEWRKLKAAVRARHGGRRAEAVTEHIAIVEALEARNAAEAQRAMRTHLDNVRLNLLGY